MVFSNQRRKRGVNTFLQICIIITTIQRYGVVRISSATHAYTPEQDHVYSSWPDSQIRDWLIEHNVIKSDAQVQREKLQKMIADHYVNAKDTIWAGWKDSDMREWLIEHGLLKSDAQKTREQLVDLMHEKYVYL